MRPKTFRTRALVTLFTAAIAITFGAHAQSSGSANIAATDVYISGSSLALEDVTATTGVNIPVQIQTSFGGLKNEQAPKVPELSAVGDLTGPGLSSPITLTTDPGHAFTIPGLPAEGTYLLQNVRLMRGSTFVQAAVPSSAAITVADILKTKVSVRQLTAAELRARGITIDERNFDVYEYTLSFFVGTQEVLVPFPVMVDKRTHEIIPINKEQKYSLPGFKNVQSPPRWGPPTVSPMELGEDEQLPGPPPEDNGGAATPPPPRTPAPAHSRRDRHSEHPRRAAPVLRRRIDGHEQRAHRQLHHSRFHHRHAEESARAARRRRQARGLVRTAGAARRSEHRHHHPHRAGESGSRLDARSAQDRHAYVQHRSQCDVSRELHVAGDPAARQRLAAARRSRSAFQHHLLASRHRSRGTHVLHVHLHHEHHAVDPDHPSAHRR